MSPSAENAMSGGVGGPHDRACDDVVLNHELVTAFARHGLPLHRVFVEMLDENVLHRTERRGCGFTQATRRLASIINLPALSATSGGDLFRPGVERVLGGRDALLRRVAANAASIEASLALPESRLLARLLFDAALRTAQGRDLGTASPDKLPIGSCPLAEQFFLEIAYGRVRRHGKVNIVVGDDGVPVLVEKCGLGDSHSSISVAPTVLNRVHVPVGSLIGIDRDVTDDESLRATTNGRGRIVPLRSLRSVRLLRLTTLAVAPDDRARTFTTHFEQQVRGELFSPDSTRIEQLIDFAAEQVA